MNHDEAFATLRKQFPDKTDDEIRAAIELASKRKTIVDAALQSPAYSPVPASSAAAAYKTASAQAGAHSGDGSGMCDGFYFIPTFYFLSYRIASDSRRHIGNALNNLLESPKRIIVTSSKS